MSEDTERSGETTARANAHNPPKALRKVWLLDAQWSDCPVEVENEVRDMWVDYELSNDHCIIKTCVADLREAGRDVVADFILEREPSMGFEEKIFIHWWW